MKQSITMLGIDLAKNAFHLCGPNRRGRIVLEKYLRREALEKRLAQLPPRVAGMEARGGAHHWARHCRAQGHEARLPGIGPPTATALRAEIGDGKDFRNGRGLAACMGLTPRQSASGGKPLLLGIAKRGDGYLRTLPAHGAPAAPASGLFGADGRPRVL